MDETHSTPLPPPPPPKKKKKEILDGMVDMVQPLFNRLGSKEFLAKGVKTQNMNKSNHYLVFQPWEPNW